MNQSDIYLQGILNKYAPHDILTYEIYSLPTLRTQLTTWASVCIIDIKESGSRIKGTAISLASDVDYLISLKNDCQGSLAEIYESLFLRLKSIYPSARKQNVSIRIKLSELEVDVTPARKLTGNTNNHNIYVSKIDSWRQTNIQKHINDVSQSGRIKEIKILKIWRQLNNLDFPSIYLEYLIIDIILCGKLKGDDYLSNNVWYIFEELAKDNFNPLHSAIIDPANSTNILSNLLSLSEKNTIISKAKNTILKSTWQTIVW